MPYVAGVDLGTTYSAAAIFGSDGPSVVDLGIRTMLEPSVVAVRSDGEILTGAAAERRLVLEPARVASEFKRRLGDPAPLLLGGVPYGAEALTGHLLRSIVRLVSEREGEPPSIVALSHPANYGSYKLGLLEEAARIAEIPDVTFVPEPVAAAVHYSQSERIEKDELIGVYDLGGGTFDASVIRRTDTGFEVVGQPGGLDRFGGIDMDAAVIGHVRNVVGDDLLDIEQSDPAVLSGLARLRDDCRSAKEALSGDTEVTIPVMIPGLHTEVRLTRAEFEDMIRPRIRETLEVLDRTVASAGVRMNDLAGVLLVGGASRIPLVGEMTQQRTGRPIAIDAHPKLTVALGTARIARDGSGQVPESHLADPPPTAVVKREPEAAQPESRSGTAIGQMTPVQVAVDTRSAAEPVADVQERHGVRGRTWSIAAAILIGVAAIALGVVLGGGGEDDPAAIDTTQMTTTSGTATTTRASTPSPSTVDLAGVDIAVIGPGEEAEDVAINEVIVDSFNGPTGAVAHYTGMPNTIDEFDKLVPAGSPPDLVLIPDAAAVVDFAAAGWLISLEDLGIDVEGIITDYGDHLMGLVEYQGEHYGVPTRPTMKSLIWYHLPTFEARGYQVPTTWDELVTLSVRMVDDGLTPWCTGTGSGELTGWPATDWVEDILLRSEGSVTYDQWADHEIDFDDPVVVRALQRLGEIVFGDGFVLGKAASIPDRTFGDALDLMADGQCVMERQADFAPLFGADLSLGDNVGIFPFPTVDGRPGALIKLHYVAAAQDRPETAAFLEWLISADVQCEIGTKGATPHASMHEQVGPECFSDPVAALAKNILEAAAPVDGTRLDASDGMPKSIGRGAFLDAMNDYFVDGPGSEVELLGRVEGSWP